MINVLARMDCNAMFNMGLNYTIFLCLVLKIYRFDPRVQIKAITKIEQEVWPSVSYQTLRAEGESGATESPYCRRRLHIALRKVKISLTMVPC